MIRVKFKGIILIEKGKLAQDFWSRLSGYMGRKKPHVEAILFSPAPAIHTFFMNFPLDVVFMDNNCTVIKVYRNLRPWRHTWFHLSAKYTLEVPAGIIPHDLKEGNQLEIENV